MRDYKETLFLPSTTFSLQGTKNEDAVRSNFVYPQTTNADFTLHDGPPYANGDIHMGHALNKILKDFVVRSQRGLGKTVDFKPGWDCHGLPIEWQVERNLVANGQSKNDMTVLEFRTLCRDYASGWVNKQCEQFKSLGVCADWDNPYLTMDFVTEAKIVSKFHDILTSNMIYRGTKPVQWSTVEQTALAEAEVEYQNLKTKPIYVAYPIPSEGEWMKNTRLLVWTTTPWTIPASAGIAFNKELAYSIYEIDGVLEDARCKVGDRFIIANDRVETVMFDIKVSNYSRIESVDPRYLEARHPLFEKGSRYLQGMILLDGKHVTADAGTGLVHTAPDHGPEDFACWHAHNMGEFPVAISPDGVYLDWVPELAGVNILNPTPKGNFIFEFTNAKVIKQLEEVGNLIGIGGLVHSYPHSWRSNAPLIYRATPQWFMRVDAMKSVIHQVLDTVQFYPENAKPRMLASIENRPDWLLSRQRVWGIPMAIFINKFNGDALHAHTLNEKIAKIFSEEGGDAWWKYSIEEWFSGVKEIAQLDPSHYEKVNDVLDVWFDSGCSHLFIEKKASLCIEGGDQFRGWYGSSLCISTMLNKAPFEAVMSHGFVLDQAGIKMSKSKGNVVDPLVETKKFGTDVIRMWVSMCDYTQDMRVGSQILKTTSEQYKKIRNTLRYLVSNLQGFDCSTDIKINEHLEHYVLFLLSELEAKVLLAYREYRFNDVMRDIMLFCNNDLSAFYFDIRKDVLYCDAKSSDRRQGCLKALSHIFQCLSSWLMPILPFAVEEARDILGMNLGLDFIKPPVYQCYTVQWEIMRTVLTAVNESLEIKRKEKIIGSSLEANVFVYLPEYDYREITGKGYGGIDLCSQAPDIFRTSQASIFKATDNVLRVEVYKAQGTKCARSWRILPEVGTHLVYPELSLRDAEAVELWDAN